MSKKLNESAMQNELSGSAFFQSTPQTQKDNSPTPLKLPPVGSQNAPKTKAIPKADEIPSIEENEASIKTDNAAEQINEVTNVRTNERFIKRAKIRHTFDIYEDQLLSLKEIALERQRALGEKTLLGDLVQEALDSIITKERNKE